MTTSKPKTKTANATEILITFVFVALVLIGCHSFEPWMDHIFAYSYSHKGVCDPAETSWNCLQTLHAYDVRQAEDRYERPAI